MKIYKVKVNGKVYEVELESVEENDKTFKLDNKTKNNDDSFSKNKTISSPMQGTIQKILVKSGDSVKKGDSLLVIETMKLENIITADNDYSILDILIKEGETVNNNQPLIRVE